MPNTIITMLVCLLSAGFSHAADSSVHQHALTPFTAQYALYRKGSKVGVGAITLIPLNNDQWEFGTESSASVLFFSAKDKERTRFIWNGLYPKPLQFNKYLEMPFKDRYIEQTFDWQNMKETGKNEKRSWQISLEPGVQDIQTQLLSLQLDLKRGKTDFHYRVSKKASIRDYRYQIIGTESLDTALGSLNTVRVERVHDKDDDRQTITWFSPEHDYIPVRLQFFDEGSEEGDLRISSIQIQQRK